MIKWIFYPLYVDGKFYVFLHTKGLRENFSILQACNVSYIQLFPLKKDKNAASSFLLKAQVT